MIDVRCGDSVQDPRGGAVVCALTVTGREYARLKAIADALNAMSGETPNYGCDADNTPATMFEKFFVSVWSEVLEESYTEVAGTLAYAGWDGAESRAVAARLADALLRADEAFAKSE